MQTNPFHAVNRVLESALNKFRSETERVAQYHNEAAAFFQHQADCVKKFKENQAFRRKAVCNDKKTLRQC